MAEVERLTLAGVTDPAPILGRFSELRDSGRNDVFTDGCVPSTSPPSLLALLAKLLLVVAFVVEVVGLALLKLKFGSDIGHAIFNC